MYRAWCDHDECICIIIWFLGMNLPGVSLKWSTFENEEQWREMTFQKKKNKKNQSIHVVSIYGIRGDRTHNQYSRFSSIDWLSPPLHNQSPSSEYRKESQIVTWDKNQTEIISVSIVWTPYPITWIGQQWYQSGNHHTGISVTSLGCNLQ